MTNGPKIGTLAAAHEAVCESFSGKRASFVLQMASTNKCGGCLKLLFLPVAHFLGDRRALPPPEATECATGD